MNPSGKSLHPNDPASRCKFNASHSVRWQDLTENMIENASYLPDSPGRALPGFYLFGHVTDVSKQ
jgi:hypothetical protein